MVSFSTRAEGAAATKEARAATTREVENFIVEVVVCEVKNVSTLNITDRLQVAFYTFQRAHKCLAPSKERDSRIGGRPES